MPLLLTLRRIKPAFLFCALSFATGAAGWAQSCPASYGNGSYLDYLSQGNCETVCGFPTASCLKVRCAQCGVIDYVYGQACVGMASSPSSLCTGCN